MEKLRIQNSKASELGAELGKEPGVIYSQMGRRVGRGYCGSVGESRMWKEEDLQWDLKEKEEQGGFLGRLLFPVAKPG